MVVALGPGKFYGSSLPRPRIYTDVKLNDDRIDPPLPVNDAFLAWATEAHWSMGGLSFKRHRLQGRIEGNINKLRSEREKLFKKSIKIKTHTEKVVAESGKDSAPRGATKRYSSPTPPPAPLAAKKRRFMKLLDEDEDNEGERETEVQIRRRPARKLWDDFDRVASDKKKVTPVKSLTPPRTRGRRCDSDETMEVPVEVNKSNSVGNRLMKVKAKRSNEKENGVSSDSSGVKTPTTPRTVKRASPRLVKRRLS